MERVGARTATRSSLSIFRETRFYNIDKRTMFFTGILLRLYNATVTLESVRSKENGKFLDDGIADRCAFIPHFRERAKYYLETEIS